MFSGKWLSLRRRLPKPLSGSCVEAHPVGGTRSLVRRDVPNMGKGAAFLLASLLSLKEMNVTLPSRYVRTGRLLL